MFIKEIVREDANTLDIHRNIDLFKNPYQAAQLVRGAKTFNAIIDKVFGNSSIKPENKNSAIENEIYKISKGMMGGVSTDQYHRLLQIANAEYGMNTAIPKINILKNVLNKIVNTFDIDGNQKRIG